MIKLTKIKFQDERKKEITFEIPKENQLEFNFFFIKREEEVCFVGGYLLALPKDEMKVFLESRDESKKLKMTQFGFLTDDRKEVWFTIPKRTSYTFRKSENDSEKAAAFAGTVFVNLVAMEI